jgi:hypothetical protein
MNYFHHTLSRGNRPELRPTPIMPAERGWGGWLGRYQTIIRQVTIEMRRAKSAGVTIRLSDKRRRFRHTQCFSFVTKALFDLVPSPAVEEKTDESPIFLS